MSEKIRRQFGCSKMMLPEHCAMLREQALAEYQAENNLVPETDEQLREEQQYILEEARVRGKTVIIKTLSSKGHTFYTGIPLICDSTRNKITIRTGKGPDLSVPAAEIISLTIVD